MENPKFISYECHMGFTTAVVFNAAIDHANMFNALNISRDNLVGAGFVRIDDEGNAQAYGKSLGLNIGCSANCTKFVQRMLNRAEWPG